ncbi:MAG: hypothetical protein OXF09_04755 [Hyphomicrobiales bacterium]|nr:hypothetical protein [Hyphomicrobiales bacterium]
MSKFFVMMSVVFAMAFGMVGNASASEDFVGVFAHDITGGLVDKDFLETDNVLENKDIGILGKSGILPFVVAHDMVKGGFLTVFGAIGGTVYGSAIVADFAVDGFAVAADSTADGFGVIADSTADGFGVIADSTADGFGIIADSIERIFNIF